ncbi:MAG: hypothetical protein M0Q48_11225, partial [Verrucomicrobia bacterium]|nr:hypothetical protein [Verrucomicrobiota bacterium]
YSISRPPHFFFEGYIILIFFLLEDGITYFIVSSPLKGKLTIYSSPPPLGEDYSNIISSPLRGED